MLQGTAEDFQG